MNKTPKEVTDMTEKLAQARAGLVRDVVKPYSDKPFNEYLNAMGKYPKDLLKSSEMLKRRKNIAKITKELFFETFTRIENPLKSKAAVIADEIEQQLIDFPIANTADHQAPLNHPFNLQGNILYMLAMHDIKVKYLFIVPFADIPLNNYCQPGGVFTSRGTVRIIPNKENRRLTIVTDAVNLTEDLDTWLKSKAKEYMRLVIKSFLSNALSKIESGEIAKMLVSISEALSSTIPEKIIEDFILKSNTKGFIDYIKNQKVIQKISSKSLRISIVEAFEKEAGSFGQHKNEVNELIGVKKMLKLIYETISKKAIDTKVQLKYWEQISIINSQIFHQQFINAPFEYIDIPLQSIVKEDLLRNHLEDVNSPIYRALFDKEFSREVIEKFNGLIESWDIEKGRSSVLFVGINPSDGSRVDLIPHTENGQMNLIDRKTSGEIINLSMTPDDIKKALEKDEIIPGLPLSLIDLALYNGFKCFGGFFQVEYLDKYKTAWINILKKFGRESEAEMVEKIPVINYASGVAQVMKKEGSSYRLANGVDILAEDGISWENLKKLGEAQGISVFASGFSGYLWEQTFFENCPYSFEEIIKLVDPAEKELIYI